MYRVVALRFWIAILTVGVLAASLLSVLGSMFLGWKFGLSGHDQIVIVNTVSAVSAFILVALGAALALIAYLSATGRPSLWPEIIFEFSYPNKPVFMGTQESGGRKVVVPYKQTRGRVIIKNTSNYAARNPGMRIELDGLQGLTTRLAGWSEEWPGMEGITSLQWDGGADNMIHGKWSRNLPQLDVTGLYSTREQPLPQLVVTIAADNFPPRRWRIPVRILDEPEYGDYTQRRWIDLDPDNQIPTKKRFKLPWQRMQ